jgi:hypothetical protein
MKIQKIADNLYSITTEPGMQSPPRVIILTRDELLSLYGLLENYHL